MSPIRQMLHQQIAQALGCPSDEEYNEKRVALLAYLRHAQPAYFRLEGGRRRSFEMMAKMEGTTVEEKLEDLALTGYLVQRSFASIPKEQALAVVAESGVPAEDRPLVEKILEEIYSSI